MPQFTVKYADARGEIRQEVAEASAAQELRDHYTQQGYLVYSIRGRREIPLAALGRRPKKLNLEKFLIFNQQFVTLFRAGLPILKSLDLLAERLTEPKLGRHVQAVRDDVRNGTLLSDAFRKQGVFPPMYVTTILAGEKSGALGEVLERYIAYQRLSLSVRKKIMLSLLYPSVLIVLVLVPDCVPDHLRGAEFRRALQEHVGRLAGDDADPDRHRHDRAQLRSGRLPRTDWRGGWFPLLEPAARRRGRRSTRSSFGFRYWVTSGSSSRWRNWAA